MFNDLLILKIGIFRVSLLATSVHGIFFFFFLPAYREPSSFVLSDRWGEKESKKIQLLETICLLIISNYRPLRGEYRSKSPSFNEARNVSRKNDTIRFNIFFFFFFMD